MDIKDLFEKYPETKVQYGNDKIIIKGEKLRSKRRRYIDCTEAKKEKYNLRLSFPNEIILDIEEFDKAEELKKRLDKKGYKYYIYKSGSRGVHAHLYFDNMEELDDDVKTELRKMFIIQADADLKLKSKDHMIAWENKPHFKTENIKTLLYSNEGINHLSQDVIEQATTISNQNTLHKVIGITDDYFKNYHKKDKLFQYILKNTIPDGTDRNNTLFPNLAVALVKEGLLKQQIEELLRPTFNTKFPYKTYGEFEGWLNKAFDGEITDYNVVQLNAWIDSYIKDNSLKYDLTPIILKDKKVGTQSERDIAKEIFEEMKLRQDYEYHMLMYEWLEKLTKVKHRKLINVVISFLAFKLRRPFFEVYKEFNALTIKGTRREYYLDEEVEKNKPEPEFWLHPFLPKGAAVLIAGNSGSYKSMFVLSLLLHAINDKPFLNSANPIGNPKIIYYDLENGPGEQSWRARFIKNGMGLNNCRIQSCQDFNRDDLNLEVEYCKNADIIVLDTLVACRKGSENDSIDAREFYTQFIDKLKAQNKTVVLIHHFKKKKFEEFTEEEIMEAIRGSGDIGAQPELVFGLLKRNETLSLDGKFKNFEIIVSHGKMRVVFYKFNNFTFTVKADIDNHSTVMEFKEYGFNLKETPKNYREKLILDIVGENQPMTANEIFKAVNEIQTVSRGTIQNDLGKLTYIKQLIQDSKRLYKLPSNTDKYD